METITHISELVVSTCPVCGVMYAMPEVLRKACRNDPKKNFYCPNGHSLVFYKSALEQEIEDLKKRNDEAERARQSLHYQLTNKTQEVGKLQRQIKIRNKRIAAGVCPCCNRTVSQLAEHMKTMHPEIANAPKASPLHKKISGK